MVQTRSAAKRIESKQFHDNDGAPKEDTTANVALEDEVPSPSPAKKPRREDATALKKRRREKRELCQLNLDVLFLIAAYIHPIDLLSLARTCKSLRELLMDKSSAFVWKTTFRQVKGLPACPADLTEPEYANLVFCERCHGCGKYTITIFWNIRRRYCPGCRVRRLRTFTSCNEVIRKNNVLATELITVQKASSKRVDRGQAASFMDDYRQPSDKTQFLNEKQKQLGTILQHAKKCEAWQRQRDLERKKDRKEQQRERCRRVFQRLEQLGYSREISYFGQFQIQRCRESDFRSSKLLTDKEWQKISPEWVKLMNGFRSRRMEYQVNEPRRHELVFAYRGYVTHPSSETSTIDLLPHVADLACLPLFKDILNAPEETRVNHKAFEPAFAQLPGLVAEWKKQLDLELAELVKIPPLSPSAENPSSPRALAPSHASCAESSNADVKKLRLACALFHTANAGVFIRNEVFSASRRGRQYEYHRTDMERSGSVSDRYGIQFLEEAPYIVQACGLDPNVATEYDMDNHNPRLKCLACEGRTLVMNWRHAMQHAYSSHRGVMLRQSLRWQAVGDEHAEAILTVEQSIKGNSVHGFMRCLFCVPLVGDAIDNMNALVCHLYNCHSLDIRKDDIKEGEHYVPLGIRNSRSTIVELVEEGNHVMFRVPSK